MRDYEVSVHLTTSQCWSMVTFLEIFVDWTQDAVQLCVAEWTPHTIHFFILWQFVLVLWFLQLCIFMLAVNYIRRQHTSVHELQPVIHLIIKIGQDRRKSLSECRLREAQRISIHTVNPMTQESQEKKRYVSNSDVPSYFTSYVFIRSAHSHFLLSQWGLSFKENVWLQFWGSSIFNSFLRFQRRSLIFCLSLFLKKISWIKVWSP